MLNGSSTQRDLLCSFSHSLLSDLRREPPVRTEMTSLSKSNSKANLWLVGSERWNT